jgi:CRISPR-associated protein Csm3
VNTFVELKSRHVIIADLLNERGLHVGSGAVSATTDAPFVLELNQPFIPGSSLRGALRSHVERILASLSGPERKFCILFDPDNAGCTAGDKALREAFEKLDADEQQRRLLADKVPLCPMCQLFGSTVMAARLKVGDAVLAAGAVPALRKRDGVGINRDTETAHPKIKYDFEVLEPGCSFQMKLEIENATDDDFALLYIALKELERGIDVGGKRSRGLGTIRLTNYRVEYFESLAEFLRTETPNKMTKDPFDARLKAALQRFAEREGFFHAHAGN